MKRVKSPPSWLVEGAIVDYHAVIGEPATQFGLRARTAPQQMDSGHWVVWLDGKAGCVSVDACTPATGSLGPSNDDSPAVQVEMRAAELEDTEHWGPASVSTHERWGSEDHHGQSVDDDYEFVTDPAYHVTDPAYHAGFLSAEIESHKDREHRDASAWAWDTSRPLAEQLAETAADDAAADALFRCDWHPEHVDDRPEGPQCDSPATHRIVWLDGTGRYSYGCDAHLGLDAEAPPVRIEKLVETPDGAS